MRKSVQGLSVILSTTKYFVFPCIVKPHCCQKYNLNKSYPLLNSSENLKTIMAEFHTIRTKLSVVSLCGVNRSQSRLTPLSQCPEESARFRWKPKNKNAHVRT
jgi:hypothetical protein